MFDTHEPLRRAAMPDLRDYLRCSGTMSLILGMLGGWVVFFLAVHLCIFKLNKIVVPILGLRLGYYMAVQGSVLVFTVLLFWFAKKQEQIDEDTRPARASDSR